MGVGYSIVFNNDLSYTFMTPAGEVSYDTFSSGEKMRLNIAISFTFRKLLFKYLNIDVNVLILDEYVDSALDKLAIGGIINLLNEICSDNPLTNIYVVSHRNEIVMEINGSKIIVQKTNGISKIIEENS
jgi:ABC-type dipeptide/oligopeptide/nickel transport system ATPase subunit